MIKLICDRVGCGKSSTVSKESIGDLTVRHNGKWKELCPECLRGWMANEDLIIDKANEMRDHFMANK